MPFEQPFATAWHLKVCNATGAVTATKPSDGTCFIGGCIASMLVFVMNYMQRCLLGHRESC